MWLHQSQERVLLCIIVFIPSVELSLPPYLYEASTAAVMHRLCADQDSMWVGRPKCGQDGQTQTVESSVEVFVLNLLLTALSDLPCLSFPLPYFMCAQLVAISIPHTQPLNSSGKLIVHYFTEMEIVLLYFNMLIIVSLMV